MSNTVGQLGNGTTVIGKDALKNHLTTPGRDNTAFGHEALQELKATQNESSAFGSQALTESRQGENSAFGAYAAANITGTGNSAFGGWAMRFMESADENTAVGHRAMAGDENAETEPVSYPDGDFNTAVGYGAMRYSPDGEYNSAVGHKSMANIDGNAHNNTGVGAGSLANVKNTTGIEGCNNTALGKDSGKTVTTGSYNTFLGSDTDSTSASGSYRTAVGAGVKVAQDDTVVIGRAIDKVGIRTNTPGVALHVVSGLSLPDGLIKADATGSGNAIHATTTNRGDAIVASASGPGPDPVNGVPLPGIALSTDGGHRYKVKPFKPLGTTPGVTDYYYAGANDHVIIANGGTGVAGYVVLPNPTDLKSGHVFIIRNANDKDLTIQCDSLPSVFYKFGASTTSTTDVISSTVVPTLVAVTYIVMGKYYYRIA
ncbi:hypothetical protein YASMINEVIRUS_1214 [Yasminevirus sp. GU-2018]|uniref:Trimeric autotransporter adhesin YadA-like head domain-containing protein n=1 Tax=Yasminevirus sp. GU-2018 TaxID=2420051 RepID=A0A5K0UAZ9_9VIRU|nr:hypothetical protein YASMINEVIRUS_1214 [Yasminevirus sp. GU-2018]